MKLSSRMKLTTAIENYVSAKAKAEADATAMPAFVAAEAILDSVWKELVPEMNPAEAARYRVILGRGAPAGAAVPTEVVLRPGEEVYIDPTIERVMRVFPGAKLVAFAKTAEELILPIGESAYERAIRERRLNQGRTNDIKRVHRAEAPMPAPAESQTGKPPEEPTLF